MHSPFASLEDAGKPLSLFYSWSNGSVMGVRTDTYADRTGSITSTTDTGGINVLKYQFDRQYDWKILDKFLHQTLK